MILERYMKLRFCQRNFVISALFLYVYSKNFKNMKKLLFLLITLFFVVFSPKNSSAQAEKTKNCFSYDFYGTLQCTDEISEGEGEICITSWKGKVQIKQQGTFTGIESGKIYTLSYVGNQIAKSGLHGETYINNIEGTAYLQCEGATIAEYKVIGHITVNATGEIVVNRYDWTDWVCK
jgi:hypothetical protein